MEHDPYVSLDKFLLYHCLLSENLEYIAIIMSVDINRRHVNVVTMYNQTSKSCTQHESADARQVPASTPCVHDGGRRRDLHHVIRTDRDS